MIHGAPFEGSYPGTTEQYVLTHLRLVEKLFIAAIVAWAIWGPVPKAPEAVAKLRLRQDGAMWPRFVPRPAWWQWHSESKRA